MTRKRKQVCDFYPFMVRNINKYRKKLKQVPIDLRWLIFDARDLELLLQSLFPRTLCDLIQEYTQQIELPPYPFTTSFRLSTCPWRLMFGQVKAQLLTSWKTRNQPNSRSTPTVNPLSVFCVSMVLSSDVSLWKRLGLRQGGRRRFCLRASFRLDLGVCPQSQWSLISYENKVWMLCSIHVGGIPHAVAADKTTCLCHTRTLLQVTAEQHEALLAVFAVKCCS